MPRYHFHQRVRGALIKDAVGRELPDVNAARAEAVKMACRAWTERPPESPDNDDMVEITDEAGEMVLKVPFSEAFAERAVT